MNAVERIKDEFEVFDRRVTEHLFAPAEEGIKRFVREHHHEIREVLERVADGEISAMDVERKLTENVVGAVVQTIEDLASEDEG